MLRALPFRSKPWCTLSVAEHARAVAFSLASKVNRCDHFIGPYVGVPQSVARWFVPVRLHHLSVTRAVLLIPTDSEETSHLQVAQPTRLTHIVSHWQGAAAGEQRLTTTLKSITSIAGGGPAKTVSSGGGKINALAVSPDGNLVATVSQDGVCRLFDFGTGRLVGGFKVRLPPC